MILRNRDVKLAKRKKSRKNHICILYACWVVKMEDVTLVNNTTICMNVTRLDVALWKGTAQRTTRHLVVTRSTTQQLHNAKCCTLECCVGLHILWQVMYVGNRLLALNRVENKRWGRMLPLLQQLLHTDNENGISVTTISLHSLSLRSHLPRSLGTARVSWLVTQAQQLLFA